MPQTFNQTSSMTKLIILIEFLLVAYLLYSLTKNVYSSYKIDKYIDTFKKENAQIENDNKQKNDDYLYFTSEEYIDKIAKQNLGLVNRGEEVIIISPDVLIHNVGSVDGTNVDNYAKSLEKSNPQRWWNFFFED